MTQPTNNGKGPFRFTRWFDSPDAVKRWLGHFAEKGIPAGIVSRGESPQYSLWRVGVDAVEYGKKPRITTDMRCDHSVNGFVGQFDKKVKEVRDGRLRLVAGQER